MKLTTTTTKSLMTEIQMKMIKTLYEQTKTQRKPIKMRKQKCNETTKSNK